MGSKSSLVRENTSRKGGRLACRVTNACLYCFPLTQCLSAIEPSQADPETDPEPSLTLLLDSFDRICLCLSAVVLSLHVPHQSIPRGRTPGFTYSHVNTSSLRKSVTWDT